MPSNVLDDGDMKRKNMAEKYSLESKKKSQFENLSSITKYLEDFQTFI